jgi:hypothetical protein
MRADTDDELDLMLADIDAGIRLLSYLQDHAEPADYPTLAPGAAFLLKALMAESEAARALYEQLAAA